MKPHLITLLVLLLATGSYAKDDKAAQKNQKAVDKEEHQFQKELKRDPNNAIVYLDHANNLAAISSECSRAAGFYLLALKYDSANARIYKDYGRYLLNISRSYPEAKIMLDKGLALSPADDEIKNDLASANKMIALQDEDNRLRDFGTTTVKELNPDTNYSRLTKFDSLKKVTNETGNRFNYQTLLARYMADDQVLTPQEMYMLMVGYSTQKSYNPFNYNDISEMRMMAGHSVKSAISRGKELVKTNPLNPSLNREMMYYYRKSNDPVQADKYLNRIKQFFSGVLYSGTGTCDKPYISLWAKEEYNFINYIGCKATANHSMGMCAGQMAESIDVINPATQKTEPVYFNVALIYMQTVGK